MKIILVFYTIMEVTRKKIEERNIFTAYFIIIIVTKVSIFIGFKTFTVTDECGTALKKLGCQIIVEKMRMLVFALLVFTVRTTHGRNIDALTVCISNNYGVVKNVIKIFSIL